MMIVTVTTLLSAAAIKYGLMTIQTIRQYWDLFLHLFITTPLLPLFILSVSILPFFYLL
jgi:hypothetical protein